MLEKHRTSQSVTIVIFKKDLTARDWPQLSKTVLPYVKTDFSRWTWEGDEWDEDDSTEIINVNMDSSSAGTKSGEPLKSVFPSRIGSKYTLLIMKMTVKSKHSFIQYENASYPTSFMGATEFPN